MWPKRPEFRGLTANPNTRAPGGQVLNFNILEAAGATMLKFKT
jgi:hypothetical protein